MAKRRKRTRPAGRKSAKPPGSVIIRKAKKKDMPAVGALNVELMRFHEKRDKSFKPATSAKAALRSLTEHKLKQIGKRNARLTVAEDRSEVIGYCLSAVTERPPIYRTRKAVQIIDMCVTAGHRRRGIGHAFFEDVREWARLKGVRRMEVTYAPSNEVSSRFWPSLGFRTFVVRGCLEV